MQQGRRIVVDLTGEQSSTLFSITALNRNALRVAALLALAAVTGSATAACGDAGTPCATDPAPSSQSASGPVDLGAGNPIHVVTGNKYQRGVESVCAGN